MTTEWLRLANFAFGGLAIFFFGLRLLSESLQAASGSIIRAVVNSLTEHRFTAFGVGFLVTVFVQSSAVSTVMTVGFANAGLMSLFQALAIVLGANLASTLTAWIFLFSGEGYAFFMMGTGVLWLTLSPNNSLAQLAKVVFAIGMIFFGLRTMTNAFVPMAGEENFKSILAIFSATQTAGILAGIGFGCLAALIFRRSAVVIGLVAALALAGAIPYTDALPMALGANLGTTLTTMLAALPANISGKRVAAGHLVFNLTMIAVAIMGFEQWIGLTEELSPATPLWRIVIAHSLLNLFGVLLFLPFLKGFVGLLEHIMPAGSRKEPQRLVFFGSVADVAPSLAIEQAYQEVKKLAAMVQSLLSLTKDYLSAGKHDEETWKRIQKYESITDNIQAEMIGFLGVIIERRLTSEQSRSVKSYLRITDELESVADKCQIITHYRKQLYENQVMIEESMSHVLDMFIDLVIEQYDLIFTSIAEGSEFQSKEYQHSMNKFNDFSKDLGDRYFQSFFHDKISPMTGLALNEISIQMREIRSHTTNIIDAYLGKKHSRLINE